MSEGKLTDYSMRFAVATVKLCDTIKYRSVITNQLLRSATSVGANIREGKYGSSRADFIAKVNCEFEKSAQMSHLCRFHPFGVKTCWGGCLPPLSPPTTERASRSLLWIPLCGTAFD